MLIYYSQSHVVASNECLDIFQKIAMEKALVETIEELFNKGKKRFS
jgi:hypothetical protein